MAILSNAVLSHIADGSPWSLTPTQGPTRPKNGGLPHDTHAWDGDLEAW